MWYGKQSVYEEKFDDQSGLFFTPEEFPELAACSGDVTVILQNAINRLIKEQSYGILYIPEGEYKLTDTVKIPPSVRLIGYGQNRPVFVLPPNTPGYNDLDKPMDTDPRKAYMKGYPGAKYMFWFIGETDTAKEEPKDASAATFYSAISNIDFRIEEGNPGAICIRAHFAQHGFVSHCHFDLGNGLAALFDVGNEMEDLTFVGGSYGIICRMCSPGWPFVLLDSVFDSQKKAAVISGTTGFTGFRLKIMNVPRGFDLYLPKAWEKLYLEDCIFDNVSDGAVTFYQTTNIVQQTNMKRIYCKNVPLFVRKEESGERTCFEEEAYLIKDYGYGYMAEDKQNAMIQEVIDIAVIDEVPDMLESDIPPVPKMQTWVSVAKYGAKGDGVTDDTDALREAVSKEDILYFPQGIYKITDTIVLKKDITLIGMSPITTQIVIEDDTPAFAGFGTPKALVETARGGFVYMNGIGIDTAGKNPRAAGIKWMADETSYMNDIKFVGGHGLMFRDGRNAYAYLYNATRTADYDPDRRWDYQYSSLWVTDGGGGVFKDLWSASPYAESGIAITNTNTHGRMYAISLEHHVRSEMKLYKVRNWEFYAMQTEEEKAEGLDCLPIELTDCEHILFANLFMFRVVAVDRSYETGIKLWNCKDVCLLNLHNKAQMHYVFTLTLKDETGGFYAKSPEYSRLYISGNCKQNKQVKKDGDYEIIAQGYDFAQGAVCDEEGNLYWCDKSQKRIYKYIAADRQVMPVYDIHYIPSALAFDTEGNLIVAVDYSELRKTIPGQPYQTHDLSNFHPFFSWFYKRSEKAYAISLDDPYNTMTELERVSADSIKAEVVYRPAHLTYPGAFEMLVDNPVKEYYVAPDKKTAIEATVDLARTLLLDKVNEDGAFLITDDAARKTYQCQTDEKGTFTDRKEVAAMGQYGALLDEDGTVWVVDDNLYIYKDGIKSETKEVPWDAYTIVAAKEGKYVIGRSNIYKI